MQFLKFRIPTASKIHFFQFLSIHPNIYYGGTGKYFGFSSDPGRGHEFYREFGQESGKNQLLIERNPKLYLRPEIARDVLNLNPKMKIIFVGE